MSFITVTRIGSSKSGLTDVYSVAGSYGDTLGVIKWYAPWRKYTFAPAPGTVFDYNCLMDIATHLELAMRNRES